MTEPFHIFADYIDGAARLALKRMGGNDIVCSIAAFAVLLLVMVLLQKLITTKAETFIPCIVAVLSTGAFCLTSVTEGRIDLRKGIFLAVTVALVMLFYIFQAEALLKWAAAVYTYSISTALLTSLIFVPISKMNGTVDKILYITNNNGIHITEPFAGLAGLPEIVWGIFLAVIASFPIIFLATQKGKA